MIAPRPLRPLAKISYNVPKRRDGAALVEGEALVRQRNEAEAAGSQHAGNRGECAKRIFDVLQDVVGDDKIDGAVIDARKGFDTGNNFGPLDGGNFTVPGRRSTSGLAQST